jgi:hypothetical protein
VQVTATNAIGSAQATSAVTASVIGKPTLGTPSISDVGTTSANASV